MPSLKQQLDKFYSKIVEHTDKNGGLVCQFFVELPSKEEYPDYYEIIKKPIALNTIRERIDNDEYKTVDEFQEDLKLIADNAKTYNRKGSQVYRDAVELQSFADALINDGATTELKDIYDKLVAIQKDGFLLCDLFMALPSKEEYPDYYKFIKKPIALDAVKKNIDSKHYKSVEDMEKDIKLMTDNAKLYNEPGSIVHQQAIDIMDNFYKLANAVEELDSIEVNGSTYKVGDFVYIRNYSDSNLQIIGCIHKIMKTKQGSRIYANYFLLPIQTVHPSTRRFYKNEVFRSDRFDEMVADDLEGRCFVLQMKDYLKGRPLLEDGTMPDEKDVYLCESKYIENAKRIEKIKKWEAYLPEKNVEVKLKHFEVPLNSSQLEKVPSPFAEEVPVKEKPKHHMEVDSKEDLRDEEDNEDDYVEETKPSRRSRNSAALSQQQQQHELNVAMQQQQRQHLQHQQRMTRNQQMMAAQQMQAHPQQQQNQQALQRNFALYTQVAQSPYAGAMAQDPRYANWMASMNKTMRGYGAAPKDQGPPDTLGDNTVKKFQNVDNKICWFPTPPLLVTKQRKLNHSEKYLEWKKSRAQERVEDVKMAPPPAKKIKAADKSKVIEGVRSELQKLADKLHNDAKMLYAKIQ